MLYRDKAWLLPWYDCNILTLHGRGLCFIPMMHQVYLIKIYAILSLSCKPLDITGGFMLLHISSVLYSCSPNELVLLFLEFFV